MLITGPERQEERHALDLHVEAYVDSNGLCAHVCEGVSVNWGPTWIVIDMCFHIELRGYSRYWLARSSLALYDDQATWTHLAHAGSHTHTHTPAHAHSNFRPNHDSWN